jgi:hypothetical protein
MLRCYVNKKQNDWVDHLWKAEYAINNATSEAFKATPTEICQGQIIRTLGNHNTTQSDAINSYLENLDLGFQVFHDALTMYRYKQADYSQKRRNPDITFKVGDLVMYQRRTWTKNLAHKLHSTWKGPYEILEINGNNCTLNIPKRYCRHPVFAQDMLKVYHDSPEHKREAPEAEEEQYIIDRIIDQRHRKSGEKEYLVQWKGYDEDENTWEPAENIENDAPGAVEDFRDLLNEIETHYIRMDTE